MMVGMKLSELPTGELIRAVRETEQVAPDGVSVAILRRELARREAEGLPARSRSSQPNEKLEVAHG